MEDITGWLLLDGKATFVKCSRWRDIETLIRVKVPRKYRLVVKTKKALSKSKAACLRRNIKALKEASVRLTQAHEEAQRQWVQNQNLIESLKEQLKTQLKSTK